MKKKLLTKTLQYYVGLSLIVLLIAAPVFFVLTTRLFRHEADEVLFLKKNEFLKAKSEDLTISQIAEWNKYSMDVTITPDDHRHRRKDRLTTVTLRDHINHEEVPYRILYSPINIQGEPFILSIKVSLIESDALIENIGRVFLLILVALLAGLFLITRILSLKLWNPFYSTVSALEGFDLEKNNVPVLLDSDVEEFDRLNRATKKLLEKNLSVYKSQKEFVENAAHELQTPIATFLAKLEVMVQEIPITQSVGESLSDLQQSASRIIRLNKNLLLLSRIENDQYASFEKVTVDAVLEKQAAFIREQMENTEAFTLTVSEPLTVQANLTLLEVAIGNLLLNALRHNLPGGSITAGLKNKVLFVSNSGLHPLNNTDNLFKRFATPGSNGGSGLGLAIVKKICDQHGWKLSYNFAENMHIFSISF